jgi:hypothetical protein
MIELIDTFPDTNVQPAEYKRLLGFPRDRVLSGRSRDLAEWARSWYTKNGRPWVYARQADKLELSYGSIVIDGVSFTSTRLRDTLGRAEADGAVLVALSAGSEIEAEARRAWEEEKPDEYFFLEIFGSAVVEHLAMMTGARLCAWADGQSLAVLPHYSPGYSEWDVAEQAKLFELIARGRNQPPLSGIHVLDSGMLRPKKSLLAVFGLTRHTDRVRRLTELVPCENCSYAPCQYRRAPYTRAPEHSQSEFPIESEVEPAETALVAVPLDRDAKYVVNTKALKRWSQERLKLRPRPDGSIDALFLYEGTTCTNMGRPLAFHYTVKLGPREQGYPILEQHCSPAPHDQGHTFMCRYMTNAEHLMVAIDKERPLLGRPLNDVLTWQRPTTGAGCYCEPADRKHKWGLVLETIHYALLQQET